MTSKGSTGMEVILSTLEVNPFNLCSYGCIGSFHFTTGLHIIKYVVILGSLQSGTVMIRYSL